MSKILSTNEIEKIILDYIEDDRKNQAILLNGEWGCGKTFFIKEMLIPQIDKEKYQIFQISLYGVSSIEIIQDMIYGKWIENVVSEKTEKFGPFCDTLVKRIGVFGKGAIQFFESKIGTDGSAAETAKAILEQNIGKYKKPVLVFDDIERCQIDIIELMGFLSKTISLQRQIFQVICTSPRPTRILSISASTTVSLSSMSILSQSFIYPLMVSMFRFPYISADI